ncbi:hypothetical protein HK101_009660 [Irineochytrium annulatum]|nr:hypothetical protein HK101_009660 [Irineochytrium annulatum]
MPGLAAARAPWRAISVIILPILRISLLFTVLTGAAIALLALAFRYGCVAPGPAAIDALRLMPFKSSAIVFGLLTDFAARFQTFCLFTKNKFLIAPIVSIPGLRAICTMLNLSQTKLDASIISALGFAGIVIVWVACKGFDYMLFFGVILLPGIAVIGVFTAALGSHWIKGGPLVGNLIRSIINFFVILCLMNINFAAVVAMFTFTNLRYELLSNANSVIASNTAFIYGTVIAFGAPLIKFVNVTLQSKIIGAWRIPPAVHTKVQERNLFMAQLMYGVSFDLVWGTAGNLLTLRSPSDELFYISAAESFALTLIQRAVFCLLFRAQRRKAMKAMAVVDVEKDVAAVVATAVMPPGDGAEVVVVAASLTDAVMETTSLNPSITRSNIHASDMPKSIAALTECGNAGFAAVIFGAGDRPSEVSSSWDVRPSKSTIGFASTRRVSNISGSQLHPREASQVSGHSNAGLSKRNESATELRPMPPGSEPAIEVEPPSAAEAAVDATPEDTTASLTENPPPAYYDEPFKPLDPCVKYGYLNIGVMLGETVGRIMAFIVIILFVTLPDASQWASYCGVVTTVQATERFAFLFATGLIVDAVSAHFDSSMLGFDYADAVEYFRSAGISFNGYVYLCASIIIVLGDYIVADTGVFFDVGIAAARAPWRAISVIILPMLRISLLFTVVNGAAIALLALCFRYGCVAPGPGPAAGAGVDDASSPSVRLMPFKASAVVFGLTTVFAARFQSFSLFAMNKFLFTPIVDSTIICALGFVGIIVAWVEFKSLDSLAFFAEVTFK